MPTPLTSGAAVVLDPVGRLRLFAVAQDGSLYQRSQTHPNNGWSAWTTLDQPVLPGQGPIPLSAADFRCPAAGPFNLIDQVGFSVLATDFAGNLYRRIAPFLDGPWRAWEQLGTVVAGSPTVVLTAGLVNYLFAVDTSQVLVELSDAAPGGYLSHTGASLLGTPAVGSNTAGLLEVLVHDFNLGLAHQWQVPGGGWSAWFWHGEPPGSLIDSSPAVAANADGRLEVFVVTSAGVLFHKWQTAPSNGWSDWQSLGSPATRLWQSVTAAANTDGRLEAFAVNADGVLFHKWQTTPGGGWSGWQSHGNPGTRLSVNYSVAVVANADGRLEAFAVDIDGVLFHKWQTAPSNGWSGWQSLGTP
jgi:hypothetical protein